MKIIGLNSVRNPLELHFFKNNSMKIFFLVKKKTTYEDWTDVR